MGLRKPPGRILSEDEIHLLIEDIRAIDADESVFVFNSENVRGTSYRPQNDTIYVKGNVLSDYNSKHPRDLMSQKAVLAHEYYGHRPYRQLYISEIEKTDLGEEAFLLKMASCGWIDEFRASYMAAIKTPRLSDDDRRYLMLDALERAKEANVSIKHNDFIRMVLHGYN